MVEFNAHSLRAVRVVVHQAYADVKGASRQKNYRSAARAVRYAAVDQRGERKDLLVNRLCHSVPDDGGNLAHYRYMLFAKNGLAGVLRLLINTEPSWHRPFIVVCRWHVERTMDSRCSGGVRLADVRRDVPYCRQGIPPRNEAQIAFLIVAIFAVLAHG